MFKKIRHALWGDLSRAELFEFGILSLTLFVILGTYWLMKPLKDAVFMKTVGRLYLPYAKIACFFFIIPLILIYSELVDFFEKQKLFYIICTIYMVLFVGFSFLLSHPTIGLANTVPHATRLLGWSLYLAIETFGSLVITLFWSFVISSTDTQLAKKGYPLVLAGAQVGAIIGPFIATHAPRIGIPNLTLTVAGGVMLVPLLIKIFISMYPATAEKSVNKKPKTGPIEGIRLLFSNWYLVGILGIATLFDIVATIMEYRFDFLVDESFATAEKVASFIGYMGLTTNSLSLLFALLGTSFLIRRFGLTFSLLLFPIATIFIISIAYFWPTLWILFAAVVIIKALSYALNNPCKEIMYIPTSKDVKFKTKSWIDMFGLRSAKALGSSFNTFFTQFISLVTYGTLISFGVIGLWLAAALYVGRKNKKLTTSGQIVE